MKSSEKGLEDQHHREQHVEGPEETGKLAERRHDGEQEHRRQHDDGLRDGTHIEHTWMDIQSSSVRNV